MKHSVKIVNGKNGWHLKVNDMYISYGHSFAGDVKAIQNELGIPYGATEWTSVDAIRYFWRLYRPLIINSTKRPYKSVWGQLLPVDINPKKEEKILSKQEQKSFNALIRQAKKRGALVLPESDITLDGLRTLRNDMNVAKIMVSTAIVELSSTGNPDFNQYAPISPKQLQPCKTYADAVNHCREYISQYNLGGGNWTGGYIYHPINGIVARISYNGRVWEATDKNLDYKNPSKEITETNLNIIER